MNDQEDEYDIRDSNWQIMDTDDVNTVRYLSFDWRHTVDGKIMLTAAYSDDYVMETITECVVERSDAHKVARDMTAMSIRTVRAYGMRLPTRTRYDYRNFSVAVQYATRGFH